MALASGESRLRLLENEMGMKGFEVCMAESGDLLFCGKATAVAACHWHAAKSRLSNPSLIRRQERPEINDFRSFLAESEGFEPSRHFRALLP